METSHSFERHCFGDICHCDFRVSIAGCEESEPARIINIINIVLCGLMVILGMYFHDKRTYAVNRYKAHLLNANFF
jgi:hypothetical protein